MAARFDHHRKALRVSRRRMAARNAARDAQWAQERLRAAIEVMPEGVVFLDPDGRYILWNRRYAEIYRNSADLFKVGARLRDTLRVGVERGDYPEAVGREDEWIAERLARLAQPVAPHEQRLADGRTILIEERKLPDGSTIGLRVDVTALKQREEGFRLLFENNPLPMFLYDARTRSLRAANEAARRHYGYAEADLRGRDVGVLFDGPAPVGAPEGAWRHRKADGAVIETHLFSRELDLDGAPAVLLAAIDVTERRRAEQRLFYMARHDALTGLPNRTLFRERVDELIGYSRPFSVMLFDLDEFKGVNDTLGHSVGDVLLEQVARRISASIRADDMAVRLGGDEFVVLHMGASSEAAIAAQVERVIGALAAPYDLDGHKVTISASVGIACAGRDGDDCDVLLKHADLALYEAKAQGRRTLRFFAPDMDARVQERRRLEADLHAAVLGGELDVHYQPLVNLADGATCGFEALLRWRHPERGYIPPSEFVPLAEDTGLIGQIGQMVLRRACEDAAHWPGELKVAVNLSPTQFKHGDVLSAVVQALAASGLAPRRLELEITEALLMERSEKVLSVLNGVRALGVGLSMDDFGTGYSSLSYLRNFPFTKIKIDQSFVRELRTSADAQAIVRAILGLGESLGLTVLAEGVEHADDVAYLKLMGCQEGQGFHFGKAEPVETWFPKRAEAPAAPLIAAPARQRA
ncbi:MAG TPA: EAL domain-containing protein [Caulobacterales bacterium]|nr:EAL domain-containing protein [Caulobacterales bacterium]